MFEMTMERALELAIGELKLNGNDEYIRAAEVIEEGTRGKKKIVRNILASQCQNCEGVFEWTAGVICPQCGECQVFEDVRVNHRYVKRQILKIETLKENHSFERIDHD